MTTPTAQAVIRDILRETIKVDASGLAPAVIGHHIDGFDEAADRILAALRPEGEAVACSYCGDTGTIPDRVDGEITCPECGYATPPAPAGVKVRPLEWHTVRSFGGDKLRAKSIAGEWWVEPAKNAADCERVERQKRECDAENEARIRSALLPPSTEARNDCAACGGSGRVEIAVDDDVNCDVCKGTGDELSTEAQAGSPAEALPSQTSGVEAFQQRVQPWMMACFGAEISADVVERNHRFLEEVLELVQSTGCTASEAHQLVDYVFGREVGETHQEIGGVMVTLAALCLALGEDMHAAGETELARIWTKVEKIRAKQAAKPKHSPLPQALAKAASEPAGGGVREALKAIAEGYAVAVHDDRYITVDNPRYQPDNGSAPKLVIDIATLSSPASSPAPAEALPDGVGALMKAVRRAEEGAGTLPAKDAVKLRPTDWHAICRLARALSPAPAQAGSFVASATPELEPNDWLLLDRLGRDNRHDGARPVIEKDQAAWDQAFRLSNAGLIAIEQIAAGGVLHITRLGTKTLGQFLLDSKAALAGAPSNGSAPAGEGR